MPVCREGLRSPESVQAEFFCTSCRTPFQNGFPLDSEGRCGLCRSGLRGFDADYCFGTYEGVLRKLIHIHKYGRVETLAGPLVDLAMAAFRRDERFDAIVPVPLAWRRRWERGFNQSELLTRVVSRRTGIPVLGELARVRATTAQAGLSNTRRRQNVAKAFRCQRRLSRRGLHGRRILLIDHAVTTGSAAAACAVALKRGEAARVAFWTVARVDRRMDAGPMRGAHFSNRETAE